MTLVEWTRLEGGQVEAVVAMLINREHPNSVRITPSRGDGGVDILDRRSGPEGSDVVYQVKRYTDPLTPRQKTEVANSLSALTKDERWADLDLVEWHLVMPWDPTPEAEAWLQDLGREHGLTPFWHGLDHVEQLAAKYPDVVDYYLHGGRARIEETHAQVAALFGAARLEQGLQVPEVTRRVEKALETLDHDPHYRFEPRFGEGPPPEPTERPGLVLHWITQDEGTGRWIAVDVIARCAASTDERPIIVKGTFRADPDSDFAEALEDFATYGTPFASPEGAYSGELLAPGGLGGPLEDGTVVIGPASDLGDNPELHLEVLDPSDVVLAAVDVDRVDHSIGVRGGMRVLLQERHGVFTIEHRSIPEEQQGSRTIEFGDIVGKPVAVVQPAWAFIAQLRAPNRLRVSVRHTSPERGLVEPGVVDFPWGEDLRQFIDAWHRALTDLSVLQAHTAEVIRVPDEIPPGPRRRWQFVAALLRGRVITGTYPDGKQVVITLEAEVAPPAAGPLRVVLPLRAEVGDQLVNLGLYEVMLETPTLVDRREIDGKVHYAFTTPDRTLRWRRHNPDDQGEAPKQAVQNGPG